MPRAVKELTSRCNANFNSDIHEYNAARWHCVRLEPCYEHILTELQIDNKIRQFTPDTIFFTFRG